MEILAPTPDSIGKVMVAYTALAVHTRVQKERAIDTAVFRAMKRERFIGVTGIVFMVIGYVLHVFVV